MENEDDLPGDGGVEDPQEEDATDVANNDANSAENKDDDDDDDDGAKAKPAKKGAAKKKYPKKARKSVKKKPDDMPRRPLSAYNYFFSSMRSKLLADRADGNDELFKEFMASEGKVDATKKNGFFSNMGKFVAKRWKSLQGTDEMKIYTGMAEKDLARYRKEMDEYREGVARKTRLASEEKLRDQDVADVSQMGQIGSGGIPSMAAAAAGSAGTATNLTGWPASPWLGGAGAAGAQFMPGAADPQLQMLLRQQVLAAQNPQLNAFLLQQQFAAAAAAGGMPGFAPQFGQLYGQQPQPDMSMMMGGAGFQGMMPNADMFQYNYGAMYPQQAPPQLQAPSGTSGGEMAGAGMPSEQQDGGQFMSQQQQQQQAGQGGQEMGNEAFM